MNHSASSTDVERSFSKGGLTVSRFRHSLSDESTRYLSVVGMWHKIPGIIPRDTVIAMFNEKNKRGANKKAKMSIDDPDVITLD